MPDANPNCAKAETQQSPDGQFGKPHHEARKLATRGCDCHLSDSNAPSLHVMSALARSGKIVPWYFCVRRKGSRG